MLDTLITSKTRIKMLLKFFTNSTASAYLRGLAEEFGESTNSIRHELNNLSKAGYLVSQEDGRTIQYRANTNHPLV
jgi:DNA-binding transcriptional regulator PaaX